MPRDRAKNFLRAANNLRQIDSRSIIRRDFLSPVDLDDLYRFQVGAKSKLELRLSGIRRGADFNVELFSLKGTKGKVFRQIGRTNFSDLKAKDIRRNLTRIGRSARRGNRNETLSLTLDPGEYYLRIFRKRGDSRYKLNLTAQLVPPTQPPSNPSTTNPLPDSGTGDPSTPPPGTDNPPTQSPSAGPAALSWLKQFGTSGNDYTYGTAIDSSNNVYVAGVRNDNGFVAKYDSNGTQSWLRELNISGSDIAFDVAVDSTGAYYVAGIQNISTSIPPSGNDAFVAKYSSDGTEQWRKTISTKVAIFGTIQSDAVDAASSITLDNNGNIYIAGLLRALPSTNNAGNAFLAKYDNDGNLITSFGNAGIAEFGGTSADAASGLAIDSSGNVYLAGITNGNLTTDFNNPVSDGNAFIAQFNGTTGIKTWDHVLASNSGQSYARGVEVDNSGNIYVAGQTAGTLPSGSLPTNSNAGGVDGFIAKYVSTGGDPQWVKQFGTAELDEAQAIAVDATGRIYVSGETNGSLFGGTSAGGADAWIAEFNNSGTLVKNIQLGTSNDDEAYSIAVESPSSVYVIGQTRGTFPDNTSQGDYDSWVAKYTWDT